MHLFSWLFPGVHAAASGLGVAAAGGFATVLFQCSAPGSVLKEEWGSVSF